MASFTIRKIDDDVMSLLEQKAAARGVSVEEEARLALSRWAQPLAADQARVLQALDDPKRYTWDEVDAAINADLDSLEFEKPKLP